MSDRGDTYICNTCGVGYEARSLDEARDRHRDDHDDHELTTNDSGQTWTQDNDNLLALFGIAENCAKQNDVFGAAVAAKETSNQAKGMFDKARTEGWPADELGDLIAVAAAAEAAWHAVMVALMFGPENVGKV